MKSISKADRVAYILVLIGTAMRFYNYSGWSLSNDELSALARLQFTSFSEMIENGVKLNDMHPPGVQTFLWFWTHIFGISVTAFRLPFVIMGSISIWIFYKISARWFNSTSALYATALFACLQFPILYSQLARPYSPGLLFSLLFVYAWSLIIFRDEEEVQSFKKQKWTYVLFVLSGFACMNSHYFSFMLAGIVGLTGLFYVKKAELKWYLLSGILMGILYIPCMAVFIHQFSIGGLGGEEGWLGKPESDAIWKYIMYIFNNSNSLAILCFLIFTGSLFINFNRSKFGKFHKLCLLFFLLPAFIAYFYSIYKNPVFQYSILLFSFPYLLMFIFSFIPEQTINARQFIMVSILVIAGFYSSAFEKKYYSTMHFPVFKEVVEKSVEYCEKYGDDKIERTINVISPFYINYYLDEFKHPLTFDLYKVSSPQQLREQYLIAGKSEKRYFMHCWSNTYNAPESELIIREFFPYMIRYNPYYNSGVMLFSKSKIGEKLIDRTLLMEEKNDFEKPKWNNESSLRDTLDAHSGNKVTFFNEACEFGPGLSKTVAEMSLEKGVTVQIKVYFKTTVKLEKPSIVLSVERDGNSVLWRSTLLSTYFLKLNEWQPAFFGYTITEDVKPNDKVSIYIWNQSKETFLSDDYLVRVIR